MNRDEIIRLVLEYRRLEKEADRLLVLRKCMASPREMEIIYNTWGRLREISSILTANGVDYE